MLAKVIIIENREPIVGDEFFSIVPCLDFDSCTISGRDLPFRNYITSWELQESCNWCVSHLFSQTANLPKVCKNPSVKMFTSFSRPPTILLCFESNAMCALAASANKLSFFVKYFLNKLMSFMNAARWTRSRDNVWDVISSNNFWLSYNGKKQTPIRQYNVNKIRWDHCLVRTLKLFPTMAV